MWPAHLSWPVVPPLVIDAQGASGSVVSGAPAFAGESDSIPADQTPPQAIDAHDQYGRDDDQADRDQSEGRSSWLCWGSCEPRTECKNSCELHQERE